MATLAAPKSVSPLIKTARWVALVAGIFYGSSRMKHLKNKEVDIQKYENKIKEQISETLKAEKIRSTAVEMERLGKELGVKPAT